MARKQQIYADFSGGFNDSLAAISIEDREVCLSENADYSAEMKSFRTRKGCTKINQTSFGYEVTDAHTWAIGSQYKKAVIINGKLYDYIEGQTLDLTNPKITLTSGATKIYPFVVYNKFYFGDGSKLYVWGDYDFSSEQDKKLYVTYDETTAVSVGTHRFVYSSANTRWEDGEGTAKDPATYGLTVSGTVRGADAIQFAFTSTTNYTITLFETGSTKVKTNQIVRNNDSVTGTSVKGKFYKSLSDQTDLNLAYTNYGDTTKWTDVTEVLHFASSVCREVIPYDPAVKEIVKISVLSGINATGYITINLDGKDYITTELTTSLTTISSILDAMKIAKTTGNISISTNWDVEVESNTLILTRKAVGTCVNGYADPGKTGVSMAYETTQEGATNDNDLDPIKKCTSFIVHTDSYRVFACGNPDDNAVFYSEIGKPNYFKSAYNKVYALNSYGRPTGMLQLSSSVLISFENGWYAWDGITPLTDATWKQLNIPYGCVSNRTIVQTPYSFMFLGRDGIYNVSASILNSELVMLQGKEVINKISRNRVDNAINSIFNAKTCEAIFFNNVYYLAYNVKPDNYSNIDTYDIGDYCYYVDRAYICTTAITVPEAFTSNHWSEVTTTPNDRILKYEWDTSSFTEVTGWLVNGWFSDNQNMYFATKNYLLKTNDGECDVDVDTGLDKAIKLHIKTKAYHFGNPFLNKCVNLIGLIFKQSTESGSYSETENVTITVPKLRKRGDINGNGLWDSDDQDIMLKTINEFAGYEYEDYPEIKQWSMHTYEGDIADPPTISDAFILSEYINGTFDVIPADYYNNWTFDDDENIWTANINIQSHLPKGKVIYNDEEIGYYENGVATISLENPPLVDTQYQAVIEYTREYDPLQANVRVIMGYDEFYVSSINLSVNVDESLVWGRNWGLIWGFNEAIVKIIEMTENSNTFQIEITNDQISAPLTLVGIGFIYQDTDFVSTTNYKDEELLT